MGWVLVAVGTLIAAFGGLYLILEVVAQLKAALP